MNRLELTRNAEGVEHRNARDAGVSKREHRKRVGFHIHLHPPARKRRAKNNDRAYILYIHTDNRRNTQTLRFSSPEDCIDSGVSTCCVRGSKVGATLNEYMAVPLPIIQLFLYSPLSTHPHCDQTLHTPTNPSLPRTLCHNAYIATS